uniref:Uncharacterized protein n=1 Tax=Kalanchoe fedtschenkoi TaxID=63787 RepID=A0A7N0TZA5_KALFE
MCSPSDFSSFFSSSSSLSLVLSWLPIMSPILSSQGVVLATAMAAVSGTVVLLAFRHQKMAHTPRPCLTSDGKRRKKKKKKKVHFADDVVEPSGDGVEFRKRHRKVRSSSSSCQPPLPPSDSNWDGGRQSVSGGKAEGRITGMPANRVALYNGMLRDRVGHRLGYSC